MKKLILLVALSFSLFYASAQTLEHTYALQSDTSINYLVGEVYKSISPDKVTHYYIQDSRTNSVKFYNLDHSLYKTVIINPPAGYKFQNTLHPSVNLFNNDGTIEFLLTIADAKNNFQMKLYNENGTMLYDFGNYYFAYVFVDNNNLFKMRTYDFPMVWNATSSKFTYNYTNSYYRLDGSVPSTLRSATIQEKVSAYPNPSNTIINLPYSLEDGETSMMSVYNTNGMLMYQKTIDSNFNSILLDVSTYPKGVYLYEYKGVSNRFIVN